MQKALVRATARREAARRAVAAGDVSAVRELLAAEVDADAWCRIAQRVTFRDERPAAAFAAEYDDLLRRLVALAAEGDEQARPVAQWLRANRPAVSLHAVPSSGAC